MPAAAALSSTVLPFSLLFKDSLRFAIRPSPGSSAEQQAGLAQLTRAMIVGPEGVRYVALGTGGGGFPATSPAKRVQRLHPRYSVNSTGNSR